VARSLDDAAVGAALRDLPERAEIDAAEGRSADEHPPAPDAGPQGEHQGHDDQPERGPGHR
jgi:hypothetical protein